MRSSAMMAVPTALASTAIPAIRRLDALTPLDSEALRLLQAAVERSVRVRIRGEIVTEGKEIVEPRMIVSGWAARVRHLADGRRQYLSFLLPGDLIGMCRQPRPLAVSTVVALTELTVCTPPPADVSAPIARAYAISGALEESYLLAHITRLGRLDARERIADLLLELNDRLALAGLAEDGGFVMPLTQETLGDALGLTSVHVNRMLQQARRAGDLDLRGKAVSIDDPAALAAGIGRTPTRVSALSPVG